jgi:hypothetical protein
VDRIPACRSADGRADAEVVVTARDGVAGDIASAAAEVVVTAWGGVAVSISGADGEVVVIAGGGDVGSEAVEEIGVVDRAFVAAVEPHPVSIPAAMISPPRRLSSRVANQLMTERYGYRLSEPRAVPVG